jgi:hypothetical protein
LEQPTANAAKIITQELRKRGASTYTMPFDVDIQKITINFLSIDCLAFIKIRTDMVDLIVNNFLQEPWFVNNRRIDVLRSESSFVQYPIKGQWHQENWSWGEYKCNNCSNSIQELRSKIEALKIQLEQEILIIYENILSFIMTKTEHNKRQYETEDSIRNSVQETFQKFRARRRIKIIERRRIESYLTMFKKLKKAGRLDEKTATHVYVNVCIILIIFKHTFMV